MKKVVAIKNNGVAVVEEGKLYNLISEDNYSWQIETPIGIVTFAKTFDDFIELKKYRKQKLNKINELSRTNLSRIKY